MKSPYRARQHEHTVHSFETLQRREFLAADLVALWNADNLPEELPSGGIIESWQDDIRSIPAVRFGSPMLVRNALNGHAVVRFDAQDGTDRLDVRSANDPLANRDDFSIVIAFATDSTHLIGSDGQWYFNSGIVDANGFGLTEDWGISINHSGQIGVGVGKPANTIYTDGQFNDGIAHIVVMTKQHDVVSLYVDGEFVQQAGFDTAPRAARPVRFGAGGQPFDGDIAEIRFYGGALNESEAQQIMATLQEEYVNLPPIAVDDEYRIQEDTSLVVDPQSGVLANDSDPESDAVLATLVDAPTNGTVELAFDGSFHYTPADDFFGSDRFTYRVADNDGSDIGVVNLFVEATYDPVQLQDDSYVAVAGTSLVVTAENGLLANDKNPDEQPLLISWDQDALPGRLSIEGDGSFQFEADAGFVGRASFRYSTIDTIGNIESAMATILVQPQAILINEFSASNLTVIDDEDGDSSDWIELWNYGDAPIDLEGWFLTDSANRLKWSFPRVRLDAGDYLLVFASGKDRNAADSELHTNFRLSSRGEYLALVADDAQTVVHSFSPSFPRQVRDVSFGVVAPIDPNTNPLVRYEVSHLAEPTPGEPNSASTIQFGPIISEVRHAPAIPSTTDDLVVTASIAAAPSTAAGINLTYRLLYDDEQTIPMVDDGSLGGDVANDGIYTAVISSSEIRANWLAAGHRDDELAGTMLRYFVSSRDASGNAFRAPYLTEVEDAPNQAEYFGTIFQSENDTSLPVLNWFVPDPDWHRTANGNRTTWSNASVFFDGQFYDNLQVRVRGQTTQNWAKPKYKFEFNPGDDFFYSSDELPVDEFNLQSHFLERGSTSYMGANLAFGFLQEIGVAAPEAFHFHVKQNGTFHSLASFVEQIDATFLQRNGRDPSGAMYKANSSAALSTLAPRPTRAHYQKVTREHEPWDDFEFFTDGINNRIDGVDRETFMFDHVNLAQVINDMAGNTLITNHDRLTKNYYMYHDPAADQWQRFPWDMDQAFSRRTDENFSSVLYGDTEHPQATGQPIYQNRLYDVILDTPSTREMYLRRLRTLLDEYLKAGYFENQIDATRALIETDAVRDNRIWQAGTISAGVSRLKQNIAFRRDQLEADVLVPDSTKQFEPLVVLSESAAGRVFVPFEEVAPVDWWTEESLVTTSDTGWLSSEGGVGYETGVGYEPFIGSLFRDEQHANAVSLLDVMDRDADGTADVTSVYVRKEFSIDDVDSIDGLELHMRYDDGFVAFLNGVEVARKNYSGRISWDKTASRNNEASDEFEVFDLTQSVPLRELALKPDGNVLAIQAINKQSNSPDFLVQPRIVALSEAATDFDMRVNDFEIEPESGNPLEQYIELKNHESFAVDISNWRLNVSDAPFISGTVIPANDSLFVAADIVSWRNRVAGPSGGMQLFVQGGLNQLAVGQTVQLYTADGTLVLNDVLRDGILGDFDQDGQLTAGDIDFFCQHVGNGQPELDLNEDGISDPTDHAYLIDQIFNSVAGDTNLDGRFDSADLVLVFQSGEYEDAIPNNSGWADGDWNCDGEFTSADLVTAFTSDPNRP